MCAIVLAFFFFNECKFIETGLGEDVWVNSWGFSKENCAEEPTPRREGEGAWPQTLSYTQFLLLLLLAHHVQLPVLPPAPGSLMGHELTTSHSSHAWRAHGLRIVAEGLES